MGSSKRPPSGVTALPIDQALDGDKAKFYSELIGKEITAINSYWAGPIFSGQGSPPRQSNNTPEVLEIVGGNKAPSPTCRAARQTSASRFS